VNHGLNFGILGPLEAGAGGRQIALGGLRQRTVLAMLLLSAGRVVSVDTLVEAVWKGRPPATGRTQVAICVAGLRKTFKAAGCTDDVIITASPGYMLLAAGHRIDALDFERRVTQAQECTQRGDAADAADLLTEALALWRGPALSGVSGHLVETEAARLEEQRLSACEQHGALRLELGQHAKVIGQLTSLVREHPLREQSRGLLMLAQYRSGRRAEALETFRDGRTQSIEEFGLEPGPALQNLQQAILRDDPALVPTVPAARVSGLHSVPGQLPARVPTFTGRDHDLSTLDTLLSEDTAVRPLRVGFVVGSPGVGKTALVVQWAHRVADRFPDGQLYADLHGYHPHQRPTDPADVLGGFLRALRVPAAQVPADLGDRTALYRSVLRGRRVLVVLENAASAAQVRPLLPGDGDCCVLVTSRGLLGALPGSYGALRLRLTGLSQQEATALLNRAVPDGRLAANRRAADGIAELCDRLPLALQIAGARLADKPHWTADRLATRLADPLRRLDELSHGEQGVRPALDASYQRLGPTAAAAYRRLALLDLPDFAPWVGAALLDTSPAEGERLLEHLVDAQLLEVADCSADGVRYRLPELVRLHGRERANLEDTAEERRACYERVFGAWLALVGEAYGGRGAQRRPGVPAYSTDHHLVRDGLACWRFERQHVVELVGDPATWLATERRSLAAVVKQAERLGMLDLAWCLATAGTTLLREPGTAAAAPPTERRATCTAKGASNPGRLLELAGLLAHGHAGEGA
jgi:DNA-binding SARP family transcriptional activator